MRSWRSFITVAVKMDQKALERFLSLKMMRWTFFTVKEGIFEEGWMRTFIYLHFGMMMVLRQKKEKFMFGVLCIINEARIFQIWRFLSQSEECVAYTAAHQQGVIKLFEVLCSRELLYERSYGLVQQNTLFSTWKCGIYPLQNQAPIFLKTLKLAYFHCVWKGCFPPSSFCFDTKGNLFIRCLARLTWAELGGFLVNNLINDPTWEYI